MTSSSELSWLMTNLREETDGVVHVLLLSGDGLTLSCDDALGRDDADELAAAASGLVSLAEGISKRFDGGGKMRSVVLDLPTKQLVGMGVAQGSALAVLAEEWADPGVIGMAMSHVIARVAPHLGVPARATGA
ncbi:roadblock/LC7 domain-containing protein [Streptomyces sp. NPDC054796]